MHSALIVCTSFWFGATPATELQTHPTVTPAVVAQLGATSYATRQSAMEQLWAAGAASVPLLEEALRNKNAEVRYRAQYVLDNLRTGIKHDTPASVLREVYRFRSEMVDQRRQAMQRLERSGRPRIVLSLLQSETDPRLRDEWSQALERSLIRSIVAGQLDEVTETLRHSTDTDAWHRHWAAFAWQRGIIDAELARPISPDTSAEIARQRIFLLRAKGDLQAASQAASDVSDELQLALLGELRDWSKAASLAVTRLEAESSASDVDPEKIAVAAAYCRLAGKQEQADQFLATIQSQGKDVLDRFAHVEPNYHQQQRDLINRNWHFAKGLLLNGRYDEAIELMRTKQAPFVFELLCEQYRFEEAFAAVGSSLANGPDPEWFRVIATESAANQDAVDQRLTVALVAVRQLAFLGRRDEALSSLLILLESARADRNTRRLRMICETAVKLSANELALEVAAMVLEKEDTSGAVAVLFPARSAMASVWWEFFRGAQGDETLLQTLHRVDALLHPGRSSGSNDVERLVASAAARVAELSDTRKIEWCHELAETCRLYGLEDLAISFYTKAAASSPDDALRLGDYFAKREKWAEAARWYHAAWQLNPNKPLPLYLYARALQHGDEAEKGMRLAELALLLPMGNSELRHDLASGLKERNYRSEAREQYELILRTGDFQDGRLIDAAKQVGNLVHATDELRAADCWETMLLCCLKPHWVFVEKGGYIQIPHLVHKTRARGLIKAGKADLAIKEAWASYRAAPANSELAEELVPLLRAAQREQDANELFAHIANRLRELGETFPQCAAFHNNLAWLLVRCEGDLNEALEYAERAAELEPSRTSFVNTLGEVHFRLGHYDEATACAERCLKAEPRSTHYHAQVERYRNALKDAK